MLRIMKFRWRKKMRKYLWLLVAPLLLTGCFNDEPKVAAPVDEAAVVEDVNTENEAVNNEVKNTVEADAEVEDTDEEIEASEGDLDSENNDDESRGTNLSNESSDKNDEETNNAELTQTPDSSTPQHSTKAQEADAIEAVIEYAEFEDDNYIYLTHLEENGEWLQVEVREEVADQDQTNLVALFRRHLATNSLEEFDFIEGDYLPVE